MFIIPNTNSSSVLRHADDKKKLQVGKMKVFVSDEKYSVFIFVEQCNLE